MTQTNTYQVLCDSVGLKPRYFAIFWDCEPDSRCEFVNEKEYKTLEEAIKRSSSEFKDQVEPRLPPATSEQRERLEELILNLGRLSYHKSDVYYICILTRINNANNGMAGTRPDALYALTHKLVQEGVLSKEEVKEVLCQTH